MTFTGLIGRLCMYPLTLIIRACVRLRIHPNILTFVGVLINIAAAWALGLGHFVTAGVIMVVANIFDFIDGKVAFELKAVSAFGGFWDSVIDRFSDLALFLGLIYLYSTLGRTDYVMVAALAMIFSIMTSYTRARAESLIAKCKVGFMERPERIVLFMIGAFTNRMAARAVGHPGAVGLHRRRPHHPYLSRAARRAAARRSHEARYPASAAAPRAVERVLLDLRTHDLAVRPDGHRDPGVRLADAAGLAGRPDGGGERTGRVDPGDADC